MHLVIVYLGRSGGGVYLSKQIANKLREAKVDFSLVLSDQNEQLAEYENVPNLLIVKTPNKRWKTLISLNFKNQATRKINNVIAEKKVSAIVFTAAHPWELGITKKMRKANQKIYRVIHDFRPHKGEFWPTRYHIYKSIKSADTCITLSEYVFGKVTLLNKSTALVALPKEEIDFEETNPIRLIPDNYFLFVGRIKRYKGLRKLINNWKKIDKDSNYLVIAGYSFLNRTSEKNKIFHLNKWLKENEIHRLIANSKGVILPYLEASQSGIIPIANYFGVPVLISDAGGLKDQLVSGTKYLKFSHQVPNDFKKILIKFTNGIYNVSEDTRAKQDLVDSLINEIRDNE